MPKIKIERVISVSSEDKVHVAENILNSDTNKKWKCKEPGEKNCWVILQLAELTKITGIDIGNENSAFVEVLVGRTGFEDSNYKVLLMMSSFMTPMDSRQSQNINRIRMFTTADFCSPVCNERWDRVKIVCTQPFNRHVLYGLSFVTLHSAADESTSSVTKLGKFALRSDPDQDDITTGNIFNKFKNKNNSSSSITATTPATSAAAIREASRPSSLSKNGLPTVNKLNIPSSNVSKPPDQTTSTATDRNRTKLLYDDSDDEPNEKIDKKMEKYKAKLKESEDNKNETESQNHNSKKQKLDESNKINSETIKQKIDDTNKTTPKPVKTSTNEPSTSASKTSTVKRKKSPDQNSNEKPKKKIRKKKSRPFRQLMNDVVFVMSGYQNPRRANLRTMALEMGAKYKPDWTTGCTHLICAFKNTPKYNEVRGRGKIVTSDWIVECHTKRKRLPWRRFALEAREQIKSDSEDEICADDIVADDNTADDDSDSNKPHNSKRYNISDSSDTEDEIERVQAQIAAEQDESENMSESKNDKETKANENKRATSKSPKKKTKVKDQGEDQLSDSDHRIYKLNSDESDGDKSRNSKSSRSKFEKFKLPESDKSDTEVKSKISKIKSKKLDMNDSEDDFNKDTDKISKIKSKKLDMNDSEDDFNKDTDIEDNLEDLPTGKIEPLPDFFKNKKFCISDSLDKETISKLKRYILAYSGSTAEDVEEADYLIVEDKNLNKFLNVPESKMVHPNWIWECHDRKLFAVIDSFIVK